VQSRRDSGDPPVRQSLGERADSAVPARAVPRAGCPQVAVVGASTKERGEGELVQHRRSRRPCEGAPDERRQRPWHHHPADAKSRRERLGHRTDQGHARAARALQRAHRPPVVAELRVVVVLDDQPVHASRPVEQRGTAPGGQHDPRGELVRRAHDHRLHLRVRGQPLDQQPLVVDRDRHGAQARRRQHVAQPVPARILNRDRRVPARDECPAEQSDRVGGARRYHEVGGLGLRAPDAGQVLGEHMTQLRVADDVRMAEVGRGHACRPSADRRHPPPHRKRSHVGQAGCQVKRDGRGGRGGWAGQPVAGGRRPVGALQVEDLGPRSHGGGQVALGAELGVRLGDDPAGAAKLVGERPGRRQRAARCEPAAADRGAKRAGQPRVQRPAAGQVKQHVRGDIGLEVLHRIG
jgi:hypothetical protein